MAWFLGYLINFNPIYINWILIITMGFEIAYIGIQAYRGKMSHFNISTATSAILYSMIGAAASKATLSVGYLGIKFFGKDVVRLPEYFLWAIRLGIIIFVIFSFQGFLMVAKLSHTVGGVDGGKGLMFLNCSKQYGDLRVAHFIGMHALQILPLISFYFIKNTRLTFLIAFFLFFIGRIYINSSHKC